jgi:phage gp29-like protein
MVAAVAATPLFDKLREAQRAGLIATDHPLHRIDAAERAGVLSSAETAQLRALDELVMDVVSVDDFDSSELGTKAKRPRRKGAAARKPKPADGQDTSTAQ